ncbi:MAG TPA: ATP-binding cassette domain-containing protein [Thermoleophilaceae bacterium]|nr:ATP-binding cassette domain-containing protein [Thermoleophilaceae bacterium]
MSLLHLESVTTSYWRGRQQTQVLRGASLAVDPGKLVSVYGKRNSGKTALLRIAGGFERPDSGCVTYAGKDLAGIARTELASIQREEIGWVDRAGPHSGELDVGTFVALPFYSRVGPRKARQRALEALDAVGADGCAKRTWSDLPDIARVLCAIAHATVRMPKLLIADDPTAGLGILDREHVCGILRRLAENDGVGVLMAVPDMPSMLQAHDIHLLARGYLLAAPESPSDGDTTPSRLPSDRRSA